MRDFWRIARMMLAHRWLLVGAIACAFLSAGGMGVGLAGIAPILANIIPRVGSDGKQIPGHDLPELARLFNEKVGGWIPTTWIDALPAGPLNAVIWIVVALGCIATFSAVCNFLHGYLSLTVVGRTVADLRRRCFEHVVHLPLRTVMAEPSQYVSRIVNDTQGVSNGLQALISRALGESTKAVAALTVAFLTDWRLALAAALIAPILGIIVRTAGRKIRKASDRGLRSQGGLYHAAGEAIDNLRVVKSSTAEPQEQERFSQATDQMLRSELRVRTVRSLASPLIELLSLCTLGALSIIAANAIIAGALDFQRFVITLTALGVAGASLKPISSFLHDVQQSSAAATRIMNLLGIPREAGHDRGLPSLARHHASIAFERVSLTYPNQTEPAVRDVSLTIGHGQTVAFVGPNGSGKTSLLALIPRLFDPDEGCGRVTIDGVDIRSVNLDSLRGQIGVVTQETTLFAGTIRSNIAYGRPGVGEAAILDASRRARAHEFIMAKPNQYDEPIGERGSGLSGGQRQRLAIARAILRDPAILILDEATSMIDADSEAKIAEALDEFARGRTCLIVAHRLSTVIHADRIVVMDNGRIADTGTHAELLARCAVYRLIAENQLVKPGDMATAAEPVAGVG